MPDPTKTAVLCEGNSVQVAGSNVVRSVDHRGLVLFAVSATGTGTWSITFSFAAVPAYCGYDASDVKTLTVTDASVGGIVTLSASTAAKNFKGWISAVSGTVAATSSLSVEGA